MRPCGARPDTLRRAIADRARLAGIYREARACLLSVARRSASAFEASALGCPLLLTDLPWARAVFGEAVRYGPRVLRIDNRAKPAAFLR